MNDKIAIFPQKKRFVQIKKTEKILLCSEINLYLQPERLVGWQNPFV